MPLTIDNPIIYNNKQIDKYGDTNPKYIIYSNILYLPNSLTNNMKICIPINNNVMIDHEYNGVQLPEKDVQLEAKRLTVNISGLTVDEAKAQLIEKELGEDIVTQEVKYVFNPELLQKYSAALSQIILQSDEISEQDKPNLIQAEKKFGIAKGTIERLYVMFPDAIEKAINLIQPIFALKGCRVQ